MKYLVIKDCFCEHYLHEVTNYPRPGLVEKRLNKDDVVILINKWSNHYGYYYRVEKDGETYDINPLNLDKING
jgi:hypothetical protein